MAESLSGLRVFIASPGGLEEERKRFRATLEEINRLEAFERGVAFIPVGWEQATPGLGRPQEKINDDVRKSDYMILVLHDRWGTPPSSGGAFSSGTEEEYEVARECAAANDRPMRDIAVMFKGVDAARMSDPGEQLKKVLDFRARLEEEHGLLFTTLDSPEEFESWVRQLLLRWIRDDDEGERAQTTLPPPNEPPSDVNSAPPGTSTEELLERATDLANEGRLTQAESLFATTVVGRADLAALTQYTRFLRRAGRLDQSVAMSNRLYEMAQERHDVAHMIEARSNRAIVERKRSELVRATSDLEEAIALARDAGPDEQSDLAFLLDNLGLTLRKQGRMDEALVRHREALEIKRGLDERRGLATTLSHVGALLRQQGQLEEAMTITQEAVDVFRDLDYARGEASARANLGELLEVSGKRQEAKNEFEASLEINTRLNSPEGVGMNLWQLGRLALADNDLDMAAGYANQALVKAREQKFDRPEAFGTPLQLMGDIALARRRFDDAIERFGIAADVFERNGQPLGAAFALSGLARANHGAGHADAAEDALGKAEGLGAKIDHATLKAALDETRIIVRG